MFVGIDIGTQSLKVVVADECLRVVGRGSRAYPVSHPHPDWAEQDPRDWDKALAPAIAEALSAAGCSATDVRAVAVTGQLDGCLPVGVDGEPSGPCLIWMDRRATEHLPELPADFRDRTGLVPDPGHMAAKASWLMARGGCEFFHQPVSYLVERLTGARVFDPALASTTMLYDLRDGGFAEDLCELFGVATSHVPSIKPAQSLAGTVTAAGAELSGLRQGTAVAVGTGDDFATPLGAAITTPGSLVCVLGTAEVVGTVSGKLVIDDAGLVETHSFVGGHYFVENPGWLSGGAVTWAKRLLGYSSDRELDADAATVPVGAAGVTFLPALSGAMAPAWRSQARGCFYGLTPAHSRAELARAVLEGCAFAMYDVKRRIDELGLPIDRVVALGGGAASDTWLQIRADICGLPVDGVVGADSCALGAVVLAAVAAGHAADVGEATALLEVSMRRFEPDLGKTKRSRAAYQRYRKLFAALEPLY